MTRSTYSGAADGRFITLLVVFAAAFRFLRIGYQSVWIDEMLTLNVTRSTDTHSIWNLLLHNIHGPLHAFVVYLFRFAGDADWWLRTPSAIAGVAGVVFFYVWVRDWLGRGVARAAALLLVINPLHVHYSQEIRNYAFLFAFAMIACYCFDRYTRSGRRRDALVYVVAMAAAALSNFSAAFLFAAHTAIYAARSGVTARSVARWALVGAAVLAIISPWVYRIYTFIDVSELVTPVLPGELDTAERLRGETTVSWWAIPYTLYAYAVGFALGPSLRELHEGASFVGVVLEHWAAVAWVGALFGALLISGAVKAVRRGYPWGEMLVYFAFPIAATLLLSWQNAKAFNVRYVILSLPVYTCLVALGVPSLRSGARLFVAAVLSLTLLASLGNLYFNGRYAREDVKRAMGYVEAQLETDQCILAPTVWQVAGHYYDGDEPIRYVFQRDWLAKARVDAQLDSVFAACNSFWYLRSRPWVDDHDGYVWRSIVHEYEPAANARFDGVDVFLMQRKSDDAKEDSGRL